MCDVFYEQLKKLKKEKLLQILIDSPKVKTKLTVSSFAAKRTLGIDWNTSGISTSQTSVENV